MLNYFKKLWHGKIPLWQAFWLWGMLGNGVWIGLYMSLFHKRFVDIFLTIFINIYIPPIFIGYFLFTLIIIWKNSPNSNLLLLSSFLRISIILFIIANIAFWGFGFLYVFLSNSKGH